MAILFLPLRDQTACYYLIMRYFNYPSVTIISQCSTEGGQDESVMAPQNAVALGYVPGVSYMFHPTTRVRPEQ